MSQFKNILITGGAGFIGSHVADELLAAGYFVRVLDNLALPTHDGSVPLWLNNRVEFMKGDVRLKLDWQRALSGIDIVIHLAAYMDFHLDFSNYVRSNIESVTLLFECIAEQKLPIKKIIMASSQSVYGEGRYECAKHGEQYLLPRGEEQLRRHDWEQHCSVCGGAVAVMPEKEDDILRPTIPYGVSKYAAELMLFNLGQLYSVPSVALRYSIVLGPRQSFRHFYSGALRQFAVNVLNGDPIQMNEDGRQLRDFIHVRDVARAHLTVLESFQTDFQSFNVGLGEGMLVEELAQLVATVAGVPFQPFLTNRFRVGGARHSLMNSNKLKSLGWSPQCTIRQAVKDYLDWVKQFGDLKKNLQKTEVELSKEGIQKSI